MRCKARKMIGMVVCCNNKCQLAICRLSEVVHAVIHASDITRMNAAIDQNMLGTRFRWYRKQKEITKPNAIHTYTKSVRSVRVAIGRLRDCMLCWRCLATVCRFLSGSGCHGHSP